jgi:hypothetical protein
VTLPEKIKQLKAAIDAVNEPCEVCGNTADEYGRIEHGRGCYVVEEDGGGYSHVPLEDLGTAARETCPPLIAAYTAALTALEASDSDRQKLAARVKELEAELDLLKTLIRYQDDIKNFKATPEMYRGFLRKYQDNPERAAELIGVSVEEILESQAELAREIDAD